jgi:hypothetical protein
MPPGKATPENQPRTSLQQEALHAVDQIGAPPSRISSRSCCGQPLLENARPGPRAQARPPWMTGEIPGGAVPLVSTRLSREDTFGSWKARWGIGRMDYRVPPGLYGTGEPGPDSPVLVTANYKMSFDRVRSALEGHNAWILVLDTRGINVWCAAGKGTFGTAELVSRIQSAGLAALVAHRTLIVPQLGGPGIAAHEVKRLSGFRVQYGPVRAEDIPAFLKEGKASEAMRTVRFGLRDRLVLAPIELVNLKPQAIHLAALLFLLQILGLLSLKGADLWPFLGAVLVGAVLTPLLLPWIPGRAFALKGWLLGLAWAAAVITLKGLDLSPGGWINGAAYGLILPSLSSFLALQFTGASTYTSLSGVIRETRGSVPLLKLSAAAGLVLWALGRFQ